MVRQRAKHFKRCNRIGLKNRTSNDRFMEISI